MSDSGRSTHYHDPYAALRVRNYRDFMIGCFLSLFGRQAVSIAIGWQIYEWTNSATALGLMGLINVIPLIALSLPAGLLADRYDRKRIISLGAAGAAVCSLVLGLLALGHDWMPHWAPLDWGNRVLLRIALVFEKQVGSGGLNFTDPELPLIYLVLFIQAVIRMLTWPARASILPLLLPKEKLSNAIMWNSTTFETATVAGPALGGFIVAWFGFASVYFLDAAIGLLFFVLLLRVRYLNKPEPAKEGHSLWTMLAGAQFIWRKKAILGASTLDLFAVLLGAITELLPVFAKEILHVGPIGLGWLRAAPSIGAVSMALWQAHRRPFRRPGAAMLWAVAGFGAAIMTFGLSKNYALSLAALLLTGVCDNVSVVVRQSLIQLLTPDHLRGRVTGVNQVFIGSSNEIGALRGGIMVALLGPVAAVTLGGAGTVVVVLLVAWLVPDLRRLKPLNTLRPEE
jgi:MFS family permease